MRVTRLVISKWRNLRDVDLVVDPEAPLVCLVGDNGTGKSASTRLQFSHLSGGEREIAFLVGQIERFKLRSGLLLIDELSFI